MNEYRRKLFNYETEMEKVKNEARLYGNVTADQKMYNDNRERLVDGVGKLYK